MGRLRRLRRLRHGRWSHYPRFTTFTAFTAPALSAFARADLHMGRPAIKSLTSGRQVDA